MDTTNLDKAIDFMKNNPGCTIAGTLNTKGHKIFRLRDERINPIMNLTVAEVDHAYKTDLFKKQDNTWILNN